MTNKLQEDFQALSENAKSTVEDYKRFYLDHPETTIHQYAKQFRATADLWYDGDIMLTILAEMCFHLGGWASGMNAHSKQVEELLEIARKDRGHGEEWQDDCDCKNSDK